MAGGAILRLCPRVDADGTAVVLTEGEVDLSTAHRIHEVCRELAAAGQTTVVLDCAGVTFMDSTGLNACVRVHGELAALGGGLELRSRPPHLARLLRLAGLEESLGRPGSPPVLDA